MADEANVRSKIHSLWEAFFPSTVYFLLFLSIAITLLGSDLFLAPLHAIRFEAISGSGIYATLKDLEILKLAPVALAFSLALAIYLFDRVVYVIGNLLPPFPTWFDSPALYVETYYLRDLWDQLPTVTNVAALDFEARRIIDQAEIGQKKLPRNSLAYLQVRTNRAAHMSLYAKAGIVWSLLMFFVAVIAGRMSLMGVGCFFLALILFLVLLAVSVILQTNLYILTTQENIRVASAMLRVQRGPSDILADRHTEFEKAYDNSMSYAPRFVGLTWSPRVEWKGLRHAFFGFPKSAASRERHHRN